MYLFIHCNLYVFVLYSCTDIYIYVSMCIAYVFLFVDIDVDLFDYFAIFVCLFASLFS